MSMHRLESNLQMSTRTRPAGAPCRILGLAVSRRFALLRELLIDLDEWCAERSMWHALPYPAALTPRLCDAIERIPFRALGKTSPRERAQDVVRRATLAFERARRAGCDGTDGECAVLSFAALGSHA